MTPQPQHTERVEESIRTIWATTNTPEDYIQLFKESLAAQTQSFRERAEALQQKAQKYPAQYLGNPQKSAGYNEGYKAALNQIKEV